MPGQKKLNARTNWQVRKNDLALTIALVAGRSAGRPSWLLFIQKEGESVKEYKKLASEGVVIKY